MYRLIGPDGREVLSKSRARSAGTAATRSTDGSTAADAAQWIAKGHYVKQRVFFADEATAIAAGYRPCANCMPVEYAAWRDS